MKMYTPLILVAAFSPIVFGNIIVEGYGTHAYPHIAARGPKATGKPQPAQSTPQSGVTGAADNLAAGIANFGNAQGSSLDALTSGTFNAAGTLLSGVFGSGAVNTAFQNFNNKPPADDSKKSHNLEELLVRSLQGKLLARATHDRLTRFHSPGVHQLRDLEVLYSRSMNNIFARSDKPKPAHTGTSGNIGAGVANLCVRSGNVVGSSVDAILSGTTNAAGTVVSGITGSGVVKLAKDGKKLCDLEDLLPKSQPNPAVPHSSLTGATDNLGAGIANLNNALGSSLDTIVSGTMNAIGTLMSGTLGSDAVKTASQNASNNPPTNFSPVGRPISNQEPSRGSPADDGKKSRDLHDLLIRSIHNKSFLSSAQP